MPHTNRANGVRDSEDGRPFWSLSASQVLVELQSKPEGLTSAEAAERLGRYGPNRLRPKKSSSGLVLFLGQFRSPITLILIGAALLSFFLRDATNALIILVIVLASGVLGFWQERGAAGAVRKLVDIVLVRATVLRDGERKDVPIEDVVPGDIVALGAGDVIPADCLLLDSKDLFLNEATLTGETYPVEKAPGLVGAGAPLKDRANALFMGTHVVSGSAAAIVVATGLATEFGRISQRLRLRPPETEFERGVRRFGYLLMEATLVLVVAIFAVNTYFARPILESLLFSVALAVGLTPQLLPAIIGINLAHGAKRLAQKKVITKRLASIENFGSMDILCSDKTGTLTEGVAHLHGALAIDASESEKVFLYAYLNAHFQTGFANPIDAAIRSHRELDVSGYRKLDEVPYDFIRKRLSVLVSEGGRSLLITKGALQNVLSVSTAAEMGDGTIADMAAARDAIQGRFEEMSESGLRVLGVACRDLGGKMTLTKDDEEGMTFLGFVVLSDPPKAGVAAALETLGTLGVELKVVTGDNRLVAASVAREVGLKTDLVLTGPQLRETSDEALIHLVNKADVFAEIEPNQKERIISALRKGGHVVGYLGDGINDASALHVADVGISVDSAVDVAKEAADIVLLEKDLAVLANGIEEGRRTFANTLKYVFMATSANFGNMFSMAGASLFLPFLPLLPKQILLMNLFTDFPEMTIATDCVDPEWVKQPRRWNVPFIRRFMLVFGLLSSIFDFLTFGVLLLLFRAQTDQFRSAWFLESVVSAALVVLVIRTRRPFFRSVPGRALLAATLAIVGVTLVVLITPLGPLFGFGRLPAGFYPAILGIVALYIAGAEGAKRLFYRRVR
jgi:Mg2+-importing ATPase